MLRHGNGGERERCRGDRRVQRLAPAPRGSLSFHFNPNVVFVTAATLAAAATLATAAAAHANMFMNERNLQSFSVPGKD